MAEERDHLHPLGFVQPTELKEIHHAAQAVSECPFARMITDRLLPEVRRLTEHGDRYLHDYSCPVCLAYGRGFEAARKRGSTP